MNDFEKFAVRGCGVNPMTLERYGNAVTAAYINPSIIEERKMNVACMDVFSRLMMDRIIFLGVGINSDVSNIIQAQMLYLAAENPSADINLYINSSGGEVFSGLAIYDTMQLISCSVKTVCTGLAASMAAVLLCAGAEGKRLILPHGRVMIHQPSGGATGRASDMVIAAKELEGTRKELCSIIASHTGRSIARVRRDSERDCWMSAAEAVKYGMVDSILKKQ